MAASTYFVFKNSFLFSLEAVCKGLDDRRKWNNKAIHIPDMYNCCMSIVISRKLHIKFLIKCCGNELLGSFFFLGDLFKVNNEELRVICEICSKLTIKPIERRQ